MPKEYRSRNGTVTALDTKTQLTELGSETSPGPLLVPAGTSRLIGAYVVAAGNYASAGSAGVLVRLEGAGLPEGPEVLAVCAMGGNSTTGIQGAMKPIWIPLGVPVTPGNEILVFAEMVGADIGQIEVGVTLVFE